MFKKILSTLTALALTLSLSTIAFASDLNKSDKIKTSTGKLVNKSEIQKYINCNPVVDNDAIKTILDEIDSKQNNKHNRVKRSDSNYGAAWPYTAQNSRRINCYGYASRFNKFINPGDISNSGGSPISHGEESPVDKVAQYVIEDLERASRGGRIIDSATAPINSNEYRIAVRMGNQQGVYDYHFMLQCSDGAWCDKPGQTPSRYLGFIDPSRYSWDLGTYIKNFYNSETIFIAVQK